MIVSFAITPIPPVRRGGYAKPVYGGIRERFYTAAR